MGKAGSPPQGVDYNTLIPLQTAANKDQFNYTLGQSRVNTVTPYGSQTWSRSPYTDNNAYYTALNRWQQANGQPVTPGPSLAPSHGPTMHILETGDAPGSGVPGGDPGVGTGDAGGSSGSGAGGPNDVNNSNVNTGSGGQNTGSGSMPLPSDFTNYNWTQTQQLSPEQQKLYEGDVGQKLSTQDIIARILGGAGQRFGAPVDFSGLTPGGSQMTASGNPVSSVGTTSQDRYSPLAGALSGFSDKIGGLNPLSINKDAADASYQSSARYLDPQVQQQQSQLEARLAQQGFVPGTPAYDQEMNQFRMANERTYADARDRATQLGATVGNQAFGNSMQGLQAQIAAALSGANFGQGQDTSSFGQRLASGNFANDAAANLFNRQTVANTQNNQTRQQQMAEMLTGRQQPLNELNSLRTGSTFAPPSFSTGQTSAPGMSGTDYLGAANSQYNGQLNAFNSQVGQDNSTYGAIASLLSAYLMSGSDRRLKMDVRRVGQTPAGTNLYEWTYIWGAPGRGVMADEVLHAAIKLPCGLYIVDYSKVQ